MAKAMNIVFGVGIAILLYMVVLLGINAFYPEPDLESDFQCEFPEPKIPVECSQNMTLAECDQLRSQNAPTFEDRESYDSCYQEFQDAREVYNKNFFLITNIIGLVLILASLFIFSYLNISVGSASAGLALIVFGFMIGWQSTNDLLKFIIGLFIASVVLYIAVKIHDREHKPKKKKKKRSRGK